MKRFVIPCFSMSFDPKWRKFIRIIKQLSKESLSSSKILTIHRIIEKIRAKNLRARLLFIYFFKAFVSGHWGKMEQTLFIFGLQTKLLQLWMMIYKNTNTVFGTQDGDTDVYKETGIFQGNTLTRPFFKDC